MTATFGIDEPAECDCGAIVGDHTEDECAGVCARCGFEPVNPAEIHGNLCRDCDHDDDFVGGYSRPRLR